MTFFIEEDVNLLRRIFLVGKMSNFWVLGGILSHFEDFPQRFGERVSMHLVGTRKQHRKGVVFGKKWDKGGIILGNNSALY